MVRLVRSLKSSWTKTCGLFCRPPNSEELLAFQLCMSPSRKSAQPAPLPLAARLACVYWPEKLKSPASTLPHDVELSSSMISSPPKCSTCLPRISVTTSEGW